MPDLSRTKPSKNFVDLTAVNPYIDRLFRILTSPTSSKQSTAGKYAELNSGYDDPHELLKLDAHMDKKKIISMMIDNMLMKVNKQSQVGRFEPPYPGLVDPTYPYPNR